MRIVGFREFCELAEGTLFQQVSDDGMELGPLSIRYAVYRVDGESRDYVERRLGAVVADAQSLGLASGSLVKAVHPDGCSRNGMFEFNHRYLVHDAEDAKLLVSLILGLPTDEQETVIDMPDTQE